MHLNWASSQYRQSDGYGRFGTHMARALKRLGVCVHPMLAAHADMPDDLARWAGIDWSHLTITCAPPYFVMRC